MTNIIRCLMQRLATPTISPLELASITIRVGFCIHMVDEFFFSITPTLGPSMLPTIGAQSDYIITSILHRRGKNVEVGDLVSFKHPIEPGERVVKRVLGMPGDFVKRETPGEASSMIQIPEGHCWVEGDNRPHSTDSRLYGPIPLALIRGKVIARYWPNPTWFDKGLHPVDTRLEKSE